ncbi:hypothetical protein ACOSP7_024998 [Xanthoceras sorbifolium]|uniref:Copper transport protein n=1 Tax=Xanthoceras sorbifolium TaxID=99658 RepID=A0ABQ8H7S0_9ROSI|nr:hypothetical protein JRO89_XS13G0112200 [Xanthoceras sorbifolium]
MDHDHMHGMGGMAAPPTSMNGTGMMHRHKMMMHMTFFWGTSAEVLFSGWPGTSTKMYAVSLVFVFVLSFLVEWLSGSRLIREGTSNVAAGVIQTLMHAIRVGLSYMVMLAVMSFNTGVFLAAIAGHTLGFLFFGSRVFKKKTGAPSYQNTSDLPPMSC